MKTPTPEFFEWIRANAGEDPSQLRLKYASKTSGCIDYSSAVTQIECRRKFATKLAATLKACPDFIFPSVLAGEQASSDRLAAYHASLLPAGQRIVDFTAGLGIDAFHLARMASEVVAVELDHERAEALRFNAGAMGLDNFRTVEGDCREFISNAITDGERYDAAFIDPARRDAAGRRVFALSDCRPDVVELMPEIARMCRKLIVKASPMLDIAHSIDAAGEATVRALALGTATDCKELLLVLDFEKEPSEPVVEAVVLTKDGEACFSFLRSEESAAALPVPQAPLKTGDYLYEAYPEVMKTGVFKLLTARYGLNVINPNTKLFYSDKLATDFPGHAYRVLEVLPFASKVIKRFRKTYPQVCVAVRNFGQSADELRRRLGVADGGPLRLYGMTDAAGERQLVLTTTELS